MKQINILILMHNYYMVLSFPSMRVKKHTIYLRALWFLYVLLINIAYLTVNVTKSLFRIKWLITKLILVHVSIRISIKASIIPTIIEKWMKLFFIWSSLNYRKYYQLIWICTPLCEIFHWTININFNVH